MVLALIGFLLGYLALRQILYAQLDRSLLRLAEIEAAATADSEDESVHFHEKLYVSPAHAEASPTRYAQVWTRDGESVIRTQNLKGRDLPLPEGFSVGSPRPASANCSISSGEEASIAVWSIH